MGLGELILFIIAAGWRWRLVVIGTMGGLFKGSLKWSMCQMDYSGQSGII